MNDLDPSDSAVNDTESDGSGKRGARDRFFLCIAMNPSSKAENPIIYKFIPADDLVSAKELFEEEFDIEPLITDVGEGNGFYVAKGTGKSNAQRISVTVSAEQLRRNTSSSFKGVFAGWNVYASGLRACSIDGIGEFDDDELVAIEFDNRVEEHSKLPKPKLKKREVIRLSDLSNVSSISD